MADCAHHKRKCHQHLPDTLHLMCSLSVARMINQTSIHEYFKLASITWYCVEKVGSVGHSSALQLCSHTPYWVPGLTQVPMEARGGQCPALVFSFRA